MKRKITYLLIFMLEVTAVFNAKAQLFLPYNDATDGDYLSDDFCLIENYEGPMFKTIKKRNPAAVTFATFDDNGILDIHCSGTLIAPDLIITAAHCTNTSDGTRVGDYALFGYHAEYADQHSNYWAAYKIIEIVEEGPLGFSISDYSILRIEGNPLSDLKAYGLLEPTPLKVYSPEVGSPISTIGYPKATGRFKSADSGIITGRINFPNNLSSDNILYNRLQRVFYFHGIQATSGASGSGILDQEGNLISILNMQFTHEFDPVIGEHITDTLDALGDLSYSLHSAILTSPTLQGLSQTIGIRVDGDEEASQTRIFVSSGPGIGESKYIRLASPQDFRNLSNNPKFISAKEGDKVELNGFVGALSQSGRKLMGVRIQEVNVTQVARTFSLEQINFIPASSNFMVDGSFTMGSKPVLLSFVFSDGHFTPRSELLQQQRARLVGLVGANYVPEYGRFRIVPNPVTSSTEIVNLDNVNNEPILLGIYNLSGEMVHRQSLKESRSVVDMTGMKEGLYIFKIFDSKRNELLVSRVVKK